jgi:GT2 family glycosyltransferase
VGFLVPGHNEPELSIVVLLTHDPSLAARCIGSIEKIAGELPPTETIFLLGGSSPEVREVIASTDGARVIDSPVNLGTSVGWQLGFNAARGRHVLLMHEDAAATAGMVPSLIEALDRNPDAAVVAPWLAERDGTEPDNCGWVWFKDQTYTRIAPEHVPPELAGNPYAVDSVSSAISLWDRSSWLAGGGFDERNFPALGVDADACTSAWARGRAVLVDPRVVGIHRTGAMDDAPGRLSGRFVRQFMLVRHQSLWLEKWHAVIDWYADRPEQAGPNELEMPALRETQRRRAQQLRIGGRFPVAEHPFTDPDSCGSTPVEVDQALVERLSEAEHEAMDEYHLWLIGHSEQQQREIEFLRQEIRTMSAREAGVIDERDRLGDDLDAIRGGRTWRLRSSLRRILGLHS